ncbi:MAG: hypothetical protein ACRCZ2_03685, partial [Fusobacteriaceae bacterium]
VNSFVIENNAVIAGNFNLFIRILDNENVLVSQGLKYEVAKGVGFTRITIPKREEDWIEQTLKELIGTTENSVVVKKRLEETIASANEVNLDLVTTTKTADEKDIVLNKTISLSIVENNNLKETIADSTDKNTELQETINDSVEKESKLKHTIEESIVKNDTLNATINDSISKDVILKATVSDSTDKNTELQETITSADIKITDINVTADDRLEEINEVADTRIEEIKVSGGAVNKFNGLSFEFWLGTTAQYEAIVEKSRGIMYNHYAEDGTLSGGYFKEKLRVVTRGLIEHFDFADGKGTEATLKSRVSDNVLTLSGFNYDENSGWTGKGLRFDGVDDNCDTQLSNPFSFEGKLTIEVVTTNGVGDGCSLMPNNGDQISRVFVGQSNVYPYVKQNLQNITPISKGLVSFGVVADGENVYL